MFGMQWASIVAFAALLWDTVQMCTHVRWYTIPDDTVLALKYTVHSTGTSDHFFFGSDG